MIMIAAVQATCRQDKSFPPYEVSISRFQRGANEGPEGMGRHLEGMEVPLRRGLKRTVFAV
jgi:hypothetical protein